ncbi:hypothetical protein DQ04_14911000 [Trypanosoma grayi]|uniref:hypothetical protein n=1 Tax=Trypanosoma grayi TaxID=71804 RepID=UPI0004F444F9|nr:hypothetical protein DQ04_14911000 [Trypanosoma grayi]KEG06267.1 hypothetical protein DQ04_14911000 [Trypanosoma grayi]
MTLENDRIAQRLAWVTASEWGETALHKKENSTPHPQGKEALGVGLGSSPKNFQNGPTRSGQIHGDRRGPFEAGASRHQEYGKKGKPNKISSKGNQKNFPCIRYNGVFGKKRGTHPRRKRSD